jgi:hypothetical protein
MIGIQTKRVMMFKYILISLLGLLNSCTLSFQNIDTHGTATDLVDENQAASPTVSPNINVPISPAIP